MGTLKSHSSVGRSALLILVIATIWTSLFSQKVGAQGQSGDQAQRPSSKMALLFERLTGAHLHSAHPIYKDLLNLDQQQNYREAAILISQTPEFELGTLRNFAAEFTSGESDPRVRLFDDLQALIVGLIIDDKDFRTVLSTDSYYNVPEEKYAGVHALTPIDKLVTRMEKPPYPLPKYAGIQTTRMFAKINYEGGTNRRPFKYLMEKFMCSPILQWKNPGFTDEYVRRDVDRSPGKGEVGQQTYQTQCRGCHVYDATNNAYSKMEYKPVTNGIEVTGKMGAIMQTIRPSPRVLQNSTVYPDGFAPKDNKWVNLLAGPDSHLDFGFPEGSATGEGLKSLGEHFAGSEQFKKCMVQKVINEVCPQNRVSNNTKSELIKKFSEVKFNMRLLFAETAVHEECLAPVPTIKSKLRIRNARQMVTALNSLVPLSAEGATAVEKEIDSNWTSLAVNGTSSELISPLTQKFNINVASTYCQDILNKNFDNHKDKILAIYQTFLQRAPTEGERQLLSAWSEKERPMMACVSATRSLEFLKLK